ncbi:MAG: flagellar hook capping FlgD N-terminal domain-containing protein [Clostridia bacterium]|nr:flagellar hook capping FlgD N-terminal domain-containing protein [Clostridia bacterium]
MYTARAAGAGVYRGSDAATPRKTLGKDEFLKILIAQMKNMDIGEGQTNEQFVAQMAQFSTLEELQNLNAGLRELAGAQVIAQAGALIGKSIEAMPPGYEVAIKGKVEAVQVIGGAPYLKVGDLKINISHVTKIS